MKRKRLRRILSHRKRKPLDAIFTKLRTINKRPMQTRR